eukprot:5816951-Pleurochrysis_carterae.AAC.1
MGDARAPRSAGCSSTYSAPDSCAARSSDKVRRTSSLDCASSRVPITCSLSRTGGGPPSAAVSLLKKRDAENVEQGDEAITAAYYPSAQRWRSRSYTESVSRLWELPPPRVPSWSTLSAIRP